MLKKKSIFISILHLFLITFASSSIANEQCSAKVNFLTVPKIQSQTVPLADEVSLKLNQYLATQSKDGAKVASNVICQQLIGASYTGSDEEWKNFLESAINGLKRNNLQDIQFTLVGEVDKVYKGDLENKEYSFVFKSSAGVQNVYNVAILDLENNTIYTISVSGHESVKESVYQEYKRIVSSFQI